MYPIYIINKKIFISQFYKTEHFYFKEAKFCKESS